MFWSERAAFFAVLVEESVVYSMQVMDRIEGLNNKRLPWEGSALSPTNRRKLGIFRASVLSLLSRDPASRVSLDEFCISCDRVLAGSTTVQLF